MLSFLFCGTYKVLLWKKQSNSSLIIRCAEETVFRLSFLPILFWGWDAAVWSPLGFIMELIISFACVVPLCFCSWLSCARSDNRRVFSLPCSAFKIRLVLEAENKKYCIHLCLSGYASIRSLYYLFFRIMHVYEYGKEKESECVKEGKSQQETGIN